MPARLADSPSTATGRGIDRSEPVTGIKFLFRRRDGPITALQRWDDDYVINTGAPASSWIQRR